MCFHRTAQNLSFLPIHKSAHNIRITQITGEKKSSSDLKNKKSLPADSIILIRLSQHKSTQTNKSHLYITSSCVLLPGFKYCCKSSTTRWHVEHFLSKKTKKIALPRLQLDHGRRTEKENPVPSCLQFTFPLFPQSVPLFSVPHGVEKATPWAQHHDLKASCSLSLLLLRSPDRKGCVPSTGGARVAALYML